MDTLCMILQLIASLSLLVIVHEFGHFIAARAFKMRVEKFYLFFNPWFTVFKYKPKNSETEYGLGWLPLGGYVKIAGMVDESMDKEMLKREPQPWEYRSKPAWQRLCVSVAGILFNFITAVIIYAGICYSWGDSYLPLKNLNDGFVFSETAKRAGFQDGDMLSKADGKTLETYDEDMFRSIIDAKSVIVIRDGKEVEITMPENFMDSIMKYQDYIASYRIRFVIDSAITGSPCAIAGLQSGDSVVAINGKEVFYSDCVNEFSKSAGKPVNLTLVRAGKSMTLQVTPDENGKIGAYVKTPKTELRKYTLLESIPAGIGKGVDKLTSYVSDFKYVFSAEGVKQMGGFASIASLYPSSFNWYAFWSITAFLSVILAFMNILPIPALDGGHAMFELYEIVFRKKPSEKFKEKAQMAGMMFLLFLMIYAQMNDVIRFLF